MCIFACKKSKQTFTFSAVDGEDISSPLPSPTVSLSGVLEEEPNDKSSNGSECCDRFCPPTSPSLLLHFVLLASSGNSSAESSLSHESCGSSHVLSDSPASSISSNGSQFYNYRPKKESGFNAQTSAYVSNSLDKEPPYDDGTKLSSEESVRRDSPYPSPPRSPAEPKGE